MTTNGQRRDYSRKIPAALVDVGIVAIPTAVAVAVLHERFEMLPGNDRGGFSPSDQERIDQIDRGFNRAIELGDSLYTLSGRGWWLTLTLVVILTVLVYVAVPSRSLNRTPGRLLMRIAPLAHQEPEFVVSIDLSDSKQTTSQDGEDPSPDDPAPEETASDETGTEGSSVRESGVEGTGVAEPNVAEPSVQEPAPGVTRCEPATAETELATAADVEQVDITDGVSFGPIALADEAEYLSWERDLISPTDLRDRTESTTTSAYEQLAIPESSLSDSPLTAAVLVKTRAANQRPQRSTQPTSALPIWNDAWKAWLYWDGEQDRWFRHDTETGHWKALS